MQVSIDIEIKRWLSVLLLLSVVILSALKTCDYIDVSWIIVFAPLWVTVSCVMGLAIAESVALFVFSRKR